jgi:hypothetical protein
MQPLTISLISFGFIFTGSLLGFYLGRVLPKPHVSDDSKETVKMAWGIVATMSALVLGLLVASAKNSFDTVNNGSTEAAAKVIILDHILVQYGPDSVGARNELRQAVDSAIKNDDQNEKMSLSSTDLENGNGMEQVQEKINALVPTNDAQRALLSQAKKISDDLFLARVLVVEQSQTFLPNILFVALVAWLAMLFMGISLFAPRNRTVLTTLFLCSASLSFAIFLINDLSHPLHGMIKISNAPMREALEYVNRH